MVFYLLLWIHHLDVVIGVTVIEIASVRNHQPGDGVEGVHLVGGKNADDANDLNQDYPPLIERVFRTSFR